jgi:hypothetical protein
MLFSSEDGYPELLSYGWAKGFNFEVLTKPIPPIELLGRIRPGKTDQLAVKGIPDMGVCGKYAMHQWTRALRHKDKVCVRCGLLYWDRSEAFFESPLQQVVVSLSNAKTTNKNGISPLKEIGVKNHSGRQ